MKNKPFPIYYFWGCKKCANRYFNSLFDACSAIDCGDPHSFDILTIIPNIFYVVKGCKLFTSEERKLLPCKYCGGSPKLTKCGDQKEFVVYLCSKCFETPVHFDEARLTECGARRIWNKRTREE